MSKNKKNKKNIFLSIGLILVCFFAYQLWAGAATSVSQLSSSGNSISDVGEETLQILSELRTLTLDEDIFLDKAFLSLEDFSMDIMEQPIGRNNPFAEIGTDGQYIGVDVGAGVINCQDEACFEKSFSSCSPSTINLEVDGVSGLIGQKLVYRYEIIGIKNGLCQVKSKFIENPNKDWIGKEMVCLYDNTNKFDEAVKDMSNCEGDLYELMNQ
jgi:hypothetical protein